MVEIKKIAVIGAGTMGHGIAEIAAIANYEVWITDVSDEILNSALEKIKWSLGKLYEKGQIKEEVDSILKRINKTVNLEEAVKDADFVIEAVPEILELKKEIFSKIDNFSPKHAILATNTSSLPITEIAEATNRKDKVIGMHFFNPPVLMPLVEIIKGKETSEETTKITYDLAIKLGKNPIIVHKDIPGFIVNRILARVFNMACWIVLKNIASIVEVDACLRYKLGFPMGAFELADYSGIDVFYFVSKSIVERGFKSTPCGLFEEKFNLKQYGVKTGKGFYEYPSPGKYSRPNIPKEASEKLDPLLIISSAINEAAFLLREGIASKEDIDKAVKLGLGYPKGIFEYADEFGIDKVVDTLVELKNKFGLEECDPDPLLLKMKNENKLGRKTGIGFYEYGILEEKKLETLILRVEPPLVWIFLNRPEKLNSINSTMVKELNRVLDEIEEDDRIRVLIISGLGRAFCAGADISEFPGISPFKAMVLSRKLQQLFTKFEYYSKPIIAAINGYALGGGLELALACDLRIATENSELGQPEINIGLIPGAGGTQRLPRLIGISKAKELIYTGDRINANEAYKIGLVDRVVPYNKLEEETRRIALKIAEKSPLSLLAAKYSIHFGIESNIWAGLSNEANLFGLLFSTEDFVEGVSAFFEKRKPKFKGK